MTNKQQLSKEDIQAIALELARVQNQQQIKPTEQAPNCERTHAKNIGGDKNINQPNKVSNSAQNQAKSKNLAQWGLILIWVSVMVALAIKLSPYL